jgi:hypothetical protein
MLVAAVAQVLLLPVPAGMVVVEPEIQVAQVLAVQPIQVVAVVETIALPVHQALRVVQAWSSSDTQALLQELQAAQSPSRAGTLSIHSQAQAHLRRRLCTLAINRYRKLL